MTPNIKVSIKSNLWNRYLSVDGNNVTQFEPLGSGVVATQSFVSTWETFELETHDDNTFSIRSTAFGGVYLRLDGTDVTEETPDGGGVVNCQYYANPPASGLELFRFKKQDDGSLAIESVQFPGVFLRMDNTNGQPVYPTGLTGTVNAQFGVQSPEVFTITVVDV